MKFVRLLLLSLGVLAGLAGLAIVLVIAPVVQTWAVQWELTHRPGIKGTVESVSAGFGEVDIDTLRLEAGGAVLTLPALKAKLPLTVAALSRTVRVRSLEAAGWTLDLSAIPGAVSPQKAALLLSGLLMRTPLPFDASWDGISLDGDVILAASGGGAPIRVHVTLAGGGLAAGHEGTYVLDAAGVTPWSASTALTAHGTLTVAMDRPRLLDRLRMDLVLSGLTGLAKDDLAIQAAAAAEPATGQEVYSFDASQGGRHLATLQARVPRDASSIAGTWAVDLTEIDLASFLPDHPLPSLVSTGGGEFEADPAFARLHVQGRLKTRATRLVALAPALGPVGPLQLDTTFDASREGATIKVRQLEAALSGERAALTLTALQPFTFDYSTDTVAVANPASDWVDATLKAVPLAWLQGLAGKAELSGTDASGEWRMRSAGGTVSFRPRGSLVSHAVVVQMPGRPPGLPMDVNAQVAGEWNHDGWKLDAAPVKLERDGHPLFSAEVHASQPSAPDQPQVITGTWKAALAGLVPASRLAALGPFAGGSASGDFTATLAEGAATEVEGKVLVAAPDASRTIAASVRADWDGNGGLSFQAPLTVTTGKQVSEFSAEGSWSGGEARNRIDLSLTGDAVWLEHLRLLAAPLLPAGPADEIRDRAPFWGDWTGRLSLGFGRLKLDDRDLLVVGGVFNLEPGAIRLTSGHGGPEGNTLTNIEGALTFTGAAERPYQLQAKIGSFEVDAAKYLPAVAGQDPLVEGRFKVSSTLAGSGASLGEVVARTQEVFEMSSTTGIVRLLRTDVSAAIPESAAPVTDTLGTVGSAVTSLLGVKKTFGEKNQLSKNADAVLDLTNQVAEIGCDLITISAARDADGTIHLLKIAMAAPDEILKGTGLISSAHGLPLTRRPVALDLTFGARGSVARLMATAHLVSAAKDDKGFSLLPRPLHFAGTLEHIDNTPWHDLLAKAAVQPPVKAP